ncbi:cytochrome P450 CYP12A2-like [Anticarsia gemmatalis]|uniref:cytochrome P450 CYP12A2-like n=1 Tax=Anticarsia gemmatalis TaxID=129554 RepID=UPI003F7715E1
MRHRALSESFSVLAVRSKQLTGNGSSRYYATATTVQDAKPFDSIPGLSSLPIIGPMHHFLPVIGEFGRHANFFDMTGALHKKFGPMVKMDGIFARANAVFLFDPDLIDQVYRSQESNPLRPGFETSEYFREVLKKDTFEGVYGLTTAQGAKWRDFRTKVNPALLKLKLVRVYTPPLDEIAQDFVERLKQLKDDSTYLVDNFLYEVTRWSLESVALVGLGSRLGCITDDLTPDHPASKLMQCAKDILKLSFKVEFLPNPWKYIATPSFNKLMKTYDTQWDISTMYINEARKRIDARGHDIPEEDKSIIEKLLAIDERVAISMANEMLLAGIDTVAFTTTNVLYHLAINPDKQEKLREEIRSDDKHKRYLKACLKEALRIWHVVPSNLRRTDKDFVVGGYHIPPGVDVIAPNQYLSRLEKYYPRPNEYIPERWLADKSDPLYYGNAHPMVTLPFGFGIRSCIGRRIAELEIELLLARVIDEFKFTWDGPPLKVVSHIINSIEKPFYFKIESAK